MFELGVAQDMKVKKVAADTCWILEHASAPTGLVEVLQSVLLQCTTSSDTVNKLM